MVRSSATLGIHDTLAAANYEQTEKRSQEKRGSWNAAMNHASLHPLCLCLLVLACHSPARAADAPKVEPD